MPTYSPTLRKRRSIQALPIRIGDRVQTAGSTRTRPIYGTVKATCETYGLLVVDEVRNAGGWFKEEEVRRVNLT